MARSAGTRLRRAPPRRPLARRAPAGSPGPRGRRPGRPGPARPVRPAVALMPLRPARNSGVTGRAWPASAPALVDLCRRPAASRCRCCLASSATAQQQKITAWEVANRWRTWPAGRIFPASGPYQVPAAAWTAAPRSGWTARVGIAPRASCRAATGWRRGCGPARRPGHPVRATTRMTGTSAHGPYLILYTAGYADGRQRDGVSSNLYASSEMKEPRSGLARDGRAPAGRAAADAALSGSTRMLTGPRRLATRRRAYRATPPCCASPRRRLAAFTLGRGASGYAPSLRLASPLDGRSRRTWVARQVLLAVVALAVLGRPGWRSRPPRPGRHRATRSGTVKAGS